MQHFAAFPALITCLALLVYVWNAMSCGSARSKHGIMAPAVTGHPDFERKLRVQQNMIEQLVVFLPALWIFCLTISTLAGAVLGLVFVLGRVLYSVSYAQDPAKRGPGFGIGMISTLILLVGALVGSVRLLLIGAF